MSKLLKNTTIYASVLVLQKATGFFLLPLYTTVLTPSDYGIVAVVTSLSTVLSILFSMSLYGAASRYYFVYSTDPKRLSRFWSSLFWFTILNSIVLGSIIILFHKVIIDPMLNSIPFFPYAFVGICSIILNPAFVFFQSCLQAEQRGFSFALNNFGFFFINLSLTIVFVLYLKAGAFGVLLAQLLTNFLFFITTLLLFGIKHAKGINRRDLKEGMSYSLPLLPHALFGWTYSTIDRLLLNNMRSTAETGIYNVGSQFGMLMNVITDSVNKAYAPWFFEKIGEGHSGKKKIEIVSVLLVSVYSFLAAGLSLIVPEVIGIMTKGDFKSAWIIVPPLAFSAVFGGVYYVVCNSLFIKHTKYVPLVTLVSALVSIAMNLLLIPSFGLVGSALASLSAQLITSIVVLYVAMKTVEIHYRWMKMYVCILVSIFVASSVYFIEINTLISFLIKSGLVLGLGAVLLCLNADSVRLVFKEKGL